jgi:hypothetical protein
VFGACLPPLCSLFFSLFFSLSLSLSLSFSLLLLLSFSFSFSLFLYFTVGPSIIPYRSHRSPQTDNRDKNRTRYRKGNVRARGRARVQRCRCRCSRENSFSRCGDARLSAGARKQREVRREEPIRATQKNEGEREKDTC